MLKCGVNDNTWQTLAYLITSSVQPRTIYPRTVIFFLSVDSFLCTLRSLKELRVFNDITGVRVASVHELRNGWVSSTSC